MHLLGRTIVMHLKVFSQLLNMFYSSETLLLGKQSIEELLSAYQVE